MRDCFCTRLSDADGKLVNGHMLPMAGKESHAALCERGSVIDVMT